MEARSGPPRRCSPGRLLDITGRHLKGGRLEVVAARRREAPHGPVANRLWRYIEEQASAFIQVTK